MPPTSMAVRPPTTRPWPLQFGKSLLPHSAHIPSDTAGAGSSSFAGTPSWQRTARLRRTEAMRSGPFTWNEDTGCASTLASAIEKPACCRRAKLVPSTSATLASRASDRDIQVASPLRRDSKIFHVFENAVSQVVVPVKRHRGEPGHTRDTRDTRTHKGTRTTQTNLTTIRGRDR